MPSSTTFTTPSASTSIGQGRININDSLFALLQNFYGSSTPTSTNITDQGVATTPPNGMLYVNSTNGALYKVDSTFTKNSTVGQNFTRYGIGYRIEKDLVHAVANIVSQYEIGEIFSTTFTGASASNARVYLKYSNSSPYIVDVGAPATNSVDSTILQDSAVTTNKIADSNITDGKLASGGKIKFNTDGRMTVGNSTLNSNNRFTVYDSYNTAYANTSNQTLTDGSTISWDLFLGQVATITLGGNRTFAAPTNMRVGTYILHVIQDGAGNRTITWNSTFKWAAGVTPTLTTTAAARDVFSFVSDGTNMYGSMLPDVK